MQKKLNNTSFVAYLKVVLIAIITCIVPITGHSKNIIYMIGDGMGPNYLTAYRYYLAQQPSANISSTIFDELWTGMAQTHPDDNTFVTDSAAAATALNTKIKSYNKAVSVDTDHQPLKTLFETAKQLNYTTGLVVTSQVTHATPAAFYAHESSRKNYPQIANQLIDNQINQKPIVDLILGGGQSDLIRADRHIVNELKDLGYQAELDFAQLDKINKLPAIGVFKPVAFEYAIDKHPDRLSKMTQQALTVLKSQLTTTDKFILLVEGSLIDWCGHDNDVACAMAEMRDFENAVKIAKQFVDNNPDTQLIITADHETGGLSIGSDGIYQWRPDYIKQTQSSIRIATEALFKTNSIEALSAEWQNHFDFALTETNKQNLFDIKNVNIETLEADALKKRQSNFFKALNKLVNQKSGTGWTTGGHTASDVPVMAYGQQSELFRGFMDNTDVATKINSLLK